MSRPGAGQIREPEHPAEDPWHIVSRTMHDLARDGIKSRFGDETSLGEAVTAAAALLEALGVAPVVPDDEPLT